MCLPSTFWGTERRTVVIPMTSQFGCLELRITRTFLSGPVKFEITRVDCIFLAKFIKFPALILSWKFEFMSGKCQGILVNSECMNPEGGVFDNKSGMISLLYD